MVAETPPFSLARFGEQVAASTATVFFTTAAGLNLFFAVEHRGFSYFHADSFVLSVLVSVIACIPFVAIAAVVFLGMWFFEVRPSNAILHATAAVYSLVFSFVCGWALMSMSA